ncbi:carbonic anhydrase 6 [Coregonus clupeaformis]|uniref:carbonic anhydrase 6 n=1 Tax=Coregonus clupeaformis TaxID=59861 RepID=UPI001BDF8800|nr:carbonic anhydrase 6 [Coregonus clupeaformis]XP_041701277.1 carbonic anhydrase 6 [Coregonus clupeaformis]
MECFSIFVRFMLVSVASAGIDGIHWTYTEGAQDQMHWAEHYPACGGRRQSPIDIQRRSVRHNPRMLQLELTGYEAQKGNFLMKNNGHSVEIVLPPSMVITKGLPAGYTAVQMHLHWGGWDLEESGAEHTLDGIRYMAELHVVHYNSDKYKSFKEASDKPDGLAVLAFFYEDGHFENTYYSDFINNLGKVKYAGQSMNISTLNVRSMLPENLNHFFRYQGSLTTPPCYESILWTVFDTPITLSHNQIRKLESTLMDMDNKTLWNDYRMAQPLNDRVVESSFLPRLGKGTFCRQDEIESRLLKIEGLITSLGKHIHSSAIGNARPSKQDPRAMFPLVLHFPERNSESYALAHLPHPMDLHSFTACMHLRTHPGGVHTVLSYSSQGHDNELMITMGYEVGLWIGNEFVNLPHNFHSRDWVNYCVTWSSHSGGAELWINGLVGEEQYLRRGYTVSPAGVFILGKDQDGFLGISDTDAFLGQMTDVNVWDYVLSSAEIQEQMSCENTTSPRGNVFSWGVTPLSLYGGVQLETDYRCP